MLSKPAFNALLKILEEPPAHVIFIMATTDAHKVPITITSRSQVFTFKLAENSVMQTHLREIANKENIKITDDALSVIVRLGGGSFRDSLSLLDQISTLTPDEITKDAIISALGLPQDEILDTLLTNYTTCDIIRTTSILKDLLSTGIRPETIAEELIKRIIQSPTSETIPLLDGLIDVSRHDFPVAKLILTFTKPIQITTTPQIQARPPENINPSASSLTPSSTQTASAPVPTPGSTQTASAPAPPPATPLKYSQKPYLKPTTLSTQSPKPPVLPREYLQPTLQAPVTAENFDWSTLLTNLSTASLSVSSQLRSATYEISGSDLIIYPSTNISKKILESPNNKNLIIKYIGSLNLVISSPNNQPPQPAPQQQNQPAQSYQPSQPAPNQPPQPNQSSQTPEQTPPKSSSNNTSPLTQLSAIMGTVKEVKIDDGEIPV